VKFRKPPRSLFKRYDDEKHWGMMIPVGRKKTLCLYDAANDRMHPPAECRMHFILTVKIYRLLVMLRMTEVRVRAGFQYL
jgi:hypothetical protein